LNQLAQGKVKAETLLQLAEELREFEMPKPVFTTGERIDWASGPFGDPHTQAEMETNIAEALRRRDRRNWRRPAAGWCPSCAISWWP